MSDANETAAEERDVLTAADAIIDDFGHHRTAEYFAGFAPEATFMFYTAERRLETRADYETLWNSWEVDDGFRVHSCESADRRVQLFGEVAIFTHSVKSRVEFGGVVDEVNERETIVFQRRDGGWLAIHEHLSAVS